MYQFLTLLLISGILFSTAGQQGDYFIAVVWQTEDGTYRFSELDYTDVHDEKHIFSFESPRHALDCPCNN